MSTRQPDKRRMTIAANGEIVPKPYGPSRWASPRRYACAHQDCPNRATITARSGHHPAKPDGEARAHNCCQGHPVDGSAAEQPDA